MSVIIQPLLNGSWVQLGYRGVSSHVQIIFQSHVYGLQIIEHVEKIEAATAEDLSCPPPELVREDRASTSSDESTPSATSDDDDCVAETESDEFVLTTTATISAA